MDIFDMNQKQLQKQAWERYNLYKGLRGFVIEVV